LASAPRLSEETEDEIVEIRIPRMREKGELDLLKLVGAECSATGWWTVREGNLGGRVVTNEASVDCTCESGPDGQDHGFLGADTVAGLRVGSGLGSGAGRPTCDIGGADGRSVIFASPADQAVERFGVAMVAGEYREMCFGHFTNSDDPLTTLQGAGQTSEVVWRHVECFDYRSLLIGEGHELPTKADTTRETGTAAATPSAGMARTMSRIPRSTPV
jgi:hypothetical protein